MSLKQKICLIKITQRLKMKITTKHLQNIELKISFPFANNCSIDELFIYQSTVKELIKLLKKDRFYLSFNRDNKGIVCIQSLVDFMHGLDENRRKSVDYPVVKIISNEDFSDKFLCITSCKNINIIFRNEENKVFTFKDDYLSNPPVDLKNLEILISCDIEYIQI